MLKLNTELYPIICEVEVEVKMQDLRFLYCCF